MTLFYQIVRALGLKYPHDSSPNLLGAEDFGLISALGVRYQPRLSMTPSAIRWVAQPTGLRQLDFFCPLMPLR